MNVRKFYFALTSILMTFLFITGLMILNYLKTYSAEEAISESNNTFLDNAVQQFVKQKDPINVVVLVGDKSEANTDTIMVVNYDPQTYKINIMSVPRDTKVTLENGKSVKINSIFANRGGNSLLLKILSDMLGLDIEYYVYFNLDTISEIIDMLGGVWIDIPLDLDYDDPWQNLHIHIKKGRQLLDGKNSVDYLRFRHPNGPYTKEMLQYYDGSDLKRIEAQQNFIKEFVKQKAKITYLSKVNDIIDAIFENLKTNISLSEVLNQISNFNIKEFNMDKINTYILPGYSIDSSPYYYKCNEEETARLINENFSIKGNKNK